MCTEFGITGDRHGRTSIYKTYLFGSPSVHSLQSGAMQEAIQLGGKKSLYGISNSEHKRLRRLTTDPINGHVALALYIGHIEDIVIPSLEDLASKNHSIKFFNEMKQIGIKVIAQIFLGSTQEDLVLSSMVKYYTELFPGVLSMPINLPGFTFHRALKARKKLVKTIQSELDERRAKTMISEEAVNPTAHSVNPSIDTGAQYVLYYLSLKAAHFNNINELRKDELCSDELRSFSIENDIIAVKPKRPNVGVDGILQIERRERKVTEILFIINHLLQIFATKLRILETIFLEKTDRLDKSEGEESCKGLNVDFRIGLI
ncbi:beta-amyrin 11-oxidase-like [Durio zibethinus]|uniref:Beta-amyrin 11-oxidase-like n=1 Tax=Durio zibethinus TaxID=66656 RepID=A0A6P5Y6W4_DURZI|nr:beta-amyrin 11-oxidase-like [Durio zibethinus]